MIDLHCHSTASDGLLAPAAVARAAVACGLTAFALTDHDSMDGVAEAREAGTALGIEVVGGCEFSVMVSWGEMHLLGYFIEPGDTRIESFLVAARADRDRRIREMVSKLVGLGIAITADDALAEANGGAAGRPHVARALERKGFVPGVQQAFDRYIGRGRPAFVEKRLPTFADVASLVHASGGIVSAAHLKAMGTRANLSLLKSEGLDAIETRHPSHNGDYLALLTDLAISLDLGRSGGSDWHGESDAAGSHAALGSQHVPDEWLPALRARAATVGGH